MYSKFKSGSSFKYFSQVLGRIFCAKIAVIYTCHISARIVIHQYSINTALWNWILAIFF